MPTDEQRIGDTNQASLFDQDAVPGSLDIESVVRAVVAEAIKRCNKSRAQIADEMSYLVAGKVTEQMLNDYTAESKPHRFPAQFIPAFCRSTGDYRLLICLLRPLGLRLINQRQSELLNLAERLEAKERADRDFENAKAITMGAAR
ncbi:MAG TPA: hypothetical protein VN577_20125 [Terriglobales bacterium]|nr:hypothetical protein [Terriglobales bacterium]